MRSPIRSRARSSRRARRAASSRVRWTTSRWAWLPPKVCSRRRIGHRRSTTVAWSARANATSASHTGSPISAVITRLVRGRPSSWAAPQPAPPVGDELVRGVQPPGPRERHDGVHVVEGVERRVLARGPRVGQ
ncbi:hypothetical protein E4N62_12050 [Streptomyces sp. MNU76]|uniref:hypothetical protein n=1 Tax=Streptomyces sp. MNU76 TaxID=2560026 RepID=UPI001E4EDD0B|nr:hypothetical protein [Streptomyces sp. MNU76]MCC9705918.1 hypothetical protein [Streptomyces sp. MNU76]